MAFQWAVRMLPKHFRLQNHLTLYGYYCQALSFIVIDLFLFGPVRAVCCLS